MSMGVDGFWLSAGVRDWRLLFAAREVRRSSPGSTVMTSVSVPVPAKMTTAIPIPARSWRLKSAWSDGKPVNGV